MPSALAGAFRTYKINYQVTIGTGVDALGNPVESYQTQTITVLLKGASDQNLRRLQSINTELSAFVDYTPIEGICSEPLTLPAAIQSGTKCELTFNGQEGYLEIIKLPPTPIAIIEQVIGEKFLGRFTSK